MSLYASTALLRICAASCTSRLACSTDMTTVERSFALPVARSWTCWFAPACAWSSLPIESASIWPKPEPPGGRVGDDAVDGRAGLRLAAHVGEVGVAGCEHDFLPLVRLAVRALRRVGVREIVCGDVHAQPLRRHARCGDSDRAEETHEP